MSLLRALFHAAAAHYFRVALEHMHIDHPDVPYVALRHALHRHQVERFLATGR
jgi:hypothetical protein